MLGVIAASYVDEPAGGTSYFDEVMADNPLAYWRLGEAAGTTMLDSSGNGRHGTYTGSPTLGGAGLLTGDADTSADFDGTNDYGSVPSAAWMSSASWSFEAVIRPDVVSGFKGIAGRWSDTNGNRSWQLGINSGPVRLVGNGTVTGATSLVAGNTYHVVVTWTSTTARLYLNGVQDGVQSPWTPQTLTQDRDLYFGQIGNGFYFDGVIDEVAFYGSALSPERVAAHYAAAVT